jgi:hypothetical protein
MQGRRSRGCIQYDICIVTGSAKIFIFATKELQRKGE